MKRLYPDPPKQHHMAFPRDFVRDVKPRSDRMRRIDFHDPVPDSPSWVWWLTGAVCGLIFLTLIVW